MYKSYEQTIMATRAQSQSLYREGKFNAAIDKLKEAWQQLPEPREAAVMSNVLASEIAESYLEDLQDYDSALVWCNTLAECHKNKVDSGEAEFIRGRVYFEMNQLEQAASQFRIADIKSDGRAFEGVDKKYRNLLKQYK